MSRLLDYILQKLIKLRGKRAGNRFAHIDAPCHPLDVSHSSDHNSQKAFKNICVDVTEASQVSEHFAAGVPHQHKDRRRFNAKLSAAPPSSLGKVYKVRIQETDAQKIVWSRPLRAGSAVSVALYHPIFRQFIGGCRTIRLQPIDKGRT